MTTRNPNYDGMNRDKHRKMRENPNRTRYLLRQAIVDCAVEVLDWEYEYRDDVGAIWYDAGIRCNDRLCLIMLHDLDTHKLNRDARARKIRAAAANNVPLLDVWPGSLIEMRAQIELWLMTMNKQPTRIRDHPPQAMGKIDRKFKDKRIV